MVLPSFFLDLRSQSWLSFTDVSQLMSASWNSDTVTFANVMPFKYSPSYININRQTYTIHFLRLVIKESSIQSYKKSELQSFISPPFMRSSTQPCVFLSFLPSFLPSILTYFLPSILLSFVTCFFLNSSILSLITHSLFSCFTPLCFPTFFLLTLFSSLLTSYFLFP